MKTQKIYQEISNRIQSSINCGEVTNTVWQGKHEAAITALLELMPSGSGIDAGTKLDDSSTVEKLIFLAPYHHMDENGYYDGWTEHKVIVTPSLRDGISIKITGRDRNSIKEYLHELFSYALKQEVICDADGEYEVTKICGA